MSDFYSRADFSSSPVCHSQDTTVSKTWRHTRGVSLIDAVVGTALVLIMFLALFSVLRVSVTVSALAKAKSEAIALLSEQMEYVRSLSYDAIGTEGGIPPGVIPETIIRSQNDTVYTLRTFVQYIDDPADGLGEEDENGIITDYKQIVLRVSYVAGGRERTLGSVSTIAPNGMETDVLGGTLFITVNDALGNPVSAASVRIQNGSTTPATDVTAFTNSLGRVFLPGAATSTGYRISVSKTGYSQAGTYTKDAVNANPNPGHLTVVEGQTTSGTFAIDFLSSLLVQTFFPIRTETFTETFLSGAGIGTSHNVAVSGGALLLTEEEGLFSEEGSATLVSLAPSELSVWEELSGTLFTPQDTSVRISLLGGDGVIIDNGVLPGNSEGFTSFPIALSSLSTSTYPSLRVRMTLSTENTSLTPEVRDVSLKYQRGPIPVPHVSFTLTGAKEIGRTSDDAPIFKNEIVTSTADNGAHQLINLEWDGYALFLSGYDIVSSCPLSPIALPPLSSRTISLLLGTSTAHALRVGVLDAGESPLKGASVTLSRNSFSETKESDACGQVYFGNLLSASDYGVTAEKAGHLSTIDTVSVSGQTIFLTTLETP